MISSVSNRKGPLWLDTLSSLGCLSKTRQEDPQFIPYMNAISMLNFDLKYLHIPAVLSRMTNYSVTEFGIRLYQFCFA